LPPYSLINLNLSWRAVMGSPIDLSAFVTNLTKKVFYYSVHDNPGSGFSSYFVGEPRMFGARARYRFGS
jgi:iron complex outermembrane receptor protein